MDSASKRRRSHPATSAAHIGAPTHMRTAPAEISWPALATDTPRSVLISLSVPGTVITPVPITKLPNSMGHSTAGRASLRGDAVVPLCADEGMTSEGATVIPSSCHFDITPTGGPGERPD